MSVLHEILHPISAWILVLVFGLGLSLGFIINKYGDDSNPSPVGVEIASNTEEGQLFGFIDSFETFDGRVYVAFDEAQLLTGEDAVTAGIEAGLCTPENPEECAPNGYFIKNTSPTARRFVVDPDAVIIMQTLNQHVFEESITLSELRELFENPRSATTWRQIPFTVSVEGGLVVRVREQDIP